MPDDSIAPLPLSIAIVCKNNIDTIGHVLDSIEGLGEEIIAVDSGSTDGTIELLERAGARVIRTEWKGHVATKQMALDACTSTWVLCLDSDEPVQPDLRQSIVEKLRGPAAVGDDVTGMRVNRVVWYCPGRRGDERGRFLRYAWQPEWRLRVVRRGDAAWGGLDPHDKLDVSRGRVIDLQGTLRHDSFASFDEQLSKQVVFSRIMAKSLRREGARGSRLRLILSPPAAFLKQLIIKQSWRDGRAGWIVAGSAAAAALTKHIILLEQDEVEAFESTHETAPDHQ
ncbi:MAG: glycosyltransferase family 2 protein [Planctomycetota bacterium]